MTAPSNWPLPADGIRFVTPQFLANKLAQHPLSQDLYPLGMGYYPQAQAHQVSRDSHDDDLLLYCTQGLGEVQARGQRVDVQAGDLILIPRGIAHQYHADKGQPWSIFWVHCTGNLSQQYYDHMGFNEDVLKLPIGLLPKVVNNFEELLAARQIGYDLAAYLHASALLKQILSYIALRSLRVPSQNASFLNIDALRAFMLEKIHQQLDLDTLAKTVNLSKFHFSKRFKALTGVSPIQYFIHLKMEHACYLLDVSTKNINEISYSLSYEDAYYFSRIFKKVIGVSPTQYRSLKRF